MIGSTITARRTGGGCIPAPCCRCRASRARSRNCAGSPSSASRRRRCGPVSGTDATRPCPNSTRCAEFEELGVVLAMHTFPSREALTPEWGRRMAAASGSGQGLLFTDEAVVYSPGQFDSNITFAMDPTIDSSEALGFMMEAMVWVTTVLMTGWLDKFPKLKAAVLESNASWLPLVLGKSKNFLDLFAFQRGNRPIKDPYESFHERCFIGFESDEVMVYRLWDLFKDVAIWSSDYPHHDAEDAWEAL